MVTNVLPLAAPVESLPEICSLVELHGHLQLLHGEEAPSLATLKKWSAAGDLASCQVAGPRPAKRAGLQLKTTAAVQRVRQLWPRLTAVGQATIIERVVDAAILRLGAPADPAGARAARPGPATESEAPGAGPGSAPAWWRDGLLEITGRITALDAKVNALEGKVEAVRRPLADFDHLRANLVRQLDEVVEHARGALPSPRRSDAPAAGGSIDVLEWARVQRDMNQIKSMMQELLGRMPER